MTEKQVVIVARDREQATHLATTLGDTFEYDVINEMIFRKENFLDGNTQFVDYTEIEELCEKTINADCMWGFSVERFDDENDIIFIMFLPNEEELAA